MFYNINTTRKKEGMETKHIIILRERDKTMLCMGKTHKTEMKNKYVELQKDHEEKTNANKKKALRKEN